MPWSTVIHSNATKRTTKGKDLSTNSANRQSYLTTEISISEFGIDLFGGDGAFRLEKTAAEPPGKSLWR